MDQILISTQSQEEKVQSPGYGKKHAKKAETEKSPAET
jgi:hypothetical protein